MVDTTITALTSHPDTFLPLTAEMVVYDAAEPTPKTLKGTVDQVTKGLRDPDFDTLKVATGSAMSKMIAGQITVGVTSLAAAAEVTDTDTLTGVASGDLIIMNPTAAPAADLTYIAWASGANTISVKFHNHHASSAATANVTFNVLSLRFV